MRWAWTKFAGGTDIRHAFWFQPRRTADFSARQVLD